MDAFTDELEALDVEDREEEELEEEEATGQEMKFWFM